MIVHRIRPLRPHDMNMKRIMILSIACTLAAFTAGCVCSREETPPALSRRWFFLSRNLVREESLPEIERIMRRASAAGYNGVLFSDVNALIWWTLEEPERYRVNAQKLRSLASELGIELAVAVFPFQWSQSFGALDPNLAAGMPVRRAPLVRRGTELVPEETAIVVNGSFENARGNRARGWTRQDGPGRISFIDTLAARSGRASIRFECTGAMDRHGHGRIFQKISVRPWQQYRIRVWLKAERLTADMVQVVALAGRRALQYESLVLPSEDAFSYFSKADTLTTGWIEQAVVFNSQSYSSVTVGAGIWGGRGGSIWWDDLRVEAVPALNVLRRGTAPLAITDRWGVEYQEGADFDPVADPMLGVSRGPGTYDSRHEAPPITLTAESRIREDERVFLSCYHPVIFYAGQVPCTISDPEIFERCMEEVRRVEEVLAPDCWFMSHDEIRCAGWERSGGQRYKSPGELLARNIARCYEIARREGAGKPVFVWSDMFDPYHNAHADYYLANGSFWGSWRGLDPRVIVMKWGDPKDAARGIRFFTRRGTRLMMAAYYGEDVEENHCAWMQAMGGAAGIEGVMYTTWWDDYSMLEEFAKVWWGG
jgi:hypothetical protein